MGTASQMLRKVADELDGEFAIVKLDASEAEDGTYACIFLEYDETLWLLSAQSLETARRESMV